jgi:hypothetical protein
VAEADFFFSFLSFFLLIGLSVRYLDGDTALEFCTKNNIVAGGGGLKMYDNGREVCFKRSAVGLTYCIISILRPTQVREIVELVVQAKKTDRVAEIGF